jgi:predicted DsbA family dithiol-disulfide isomerase
VRLQVRLVLSIEIVSDVVCPWCFLGHARLRKALAERPALEVDVRFTPFLLDPSMPEGGADLRERLRAKYGVAPASMFARVEAAAKDSGIELDFEKVRRFPSTLGAHVVIDHARARGTQPALADAIFAAYFQGGLDVGDPDVLDGIATAQGFSPGEARGLATDEAERTRIRILALEQVERGVSGVPFFILDGRRAVTGAQEVATWRTVLDRVAASASA